MDAFVDILFLTLVDIRSIKERNIYTDLLRELVGIGNTVYIVSPYERRERKKTCMLEEENCTILKVRIGNIQQTNVLEKGISTMLLETVYQRAIKKYFGGIKFDLMLYSTPPITLTRVAEWVKRRDNASTYLLLKDIFPQNAVDLGMMSPNSLLYKYFRNKEKKLYSISDRIGCMSQANVDYVLQHNPEVSPNKVEVFPNCIEMQQIIITDNERVAIRRKYGLPLDKKVFIYGGNLGKPQGVDFIIKCLTALKDDEEPFFFIVGSGTEYVKLERFVNDIKPGNVKLMRSIPKDDFDRMLAACDVGLIFLDHRFTIPNFPSRLLSYVQARLPVLACTDTATDIGKVIVENGLGWWCESNDPSVAARIMREICNSELDAPQYANPIDDLFSTKAVYKKVLNLS